jgi:hypothetical protein
MGRSNEDRTQMHGKLNGIPIPHIIYNLPHVRLGVAKDLQLSDMFDFERTETLF